jgi:hypothetical protein
MKMEPPPRLFSHQCLEGDLSVRAVVRRREGIRLTPGLA